MFMPFRIHREGYGNMPDKLRFEGGRLKDYGSKVEPLGFQKKP